MPRHDSFFDDQITNLDGYYMSDAWVELGGEYIYIEWTKDSTVGQEFVSWFYAEPSFYFSATNGDFVATTIQVKNDLRSTPYDVAVVTLILKSPRVIARDETVQLVRSSGGGVAAVSNDRSQVNISTTADKTIRNYSMVGATGAISALARRGSSSYFVQTDPETDTNFDFSVADGTLNTSEGLLKGTGITLRTRRGAIAMNPTDSDFNGEKSFEGSGNWIGEIDGHQGFSGDFSMLFAVHLPQGSKISYSQVTETGGSQNGGGPLSGDGGSDIGRRPDVVGELNLVVNSITQENTTIEFTINDLWALDADNERHRFEWDIPENVGVGMIKDRTYVFGIKYDESEGEITVYSGGGNPVDLISHTVTEPSLGANDYFAFRTEGQAKFTEILHISSAIEDSEMQEYLAFLDEKYATSSQSFYVDGEFGVDTNDGTIANPLKTIPEAVSRCVPGMGDQVFLKNGNIFLALDEIDLFPSDVQAAPMGYSPDYPFILGSYGDRSSGRPELQFISGASKFLNTEQHSDNVLIYGLNLKSPERDINNGSFVGQTAMKSLTDGYGIYKRSTQHAFEHTPESLRVFDCEIQNTLRHGVTISSAFSTTTPPNKYSAVVKTGFRNLYNAKYMSENQNPDIGTSNYGIAGIFAEKQTGLHVQDCLFYRVGWSPDLVLDTGISVASGLVYSEATQSIQGNLLFLYLNTYDDWEYASYGYHNNQRILITGISGGSESEFAAISEGILIIGGTLGFYLKEPPSIIGDQHTCGIQVLDPFPRCSGNADIITGEESYGHTTICNSIFVESSGYNIISNDGITYYSCVSENNPFGVLMSDTYTSVIDSYFGGTVGTAPIRKSPVNTGITIGDVYVSNERDRHGWMVKSQANKNILNGVFTGTIYARESGTDFDNKISDIPLNSAFHFDKTTNSMVFSVNIKKNTFWSIPGSVFVFGTENENSSGRLEIERNIIDHEIDYSSGSFGSSADSFTYTFKDPFSQNVTNIWGLGNFGEQTEINLYNQRNLATAPPDGFAQYLTESTIFESIGFDFWRATEESEFGEWIDITYTDAPRSLATYNSSELGGTTSAIEFVSNAFDAHDSGWSEGYSADSILTYIRAGYQPTNLDQASYGEDFIGAVEFNHTPSTTGFNPFFGGDGENFGFGKGN